MRTCGPQARPAAQILDAARPVILPGIATAEVRMDDIAAHAGVAKGTVYRYFHDKEDLYLALTRHGLNRLFEESQGTILGFGDPGRQAARLHRADCAFLREQYPVFSGVDPAHRNIATSPESLNTLNEIRTQFYHAGHRPDHATQRAKPIEHPALTALALLGMIRGILRFTPQPWPSHLADWMHHQFMHGFVASTQAAL